SSRMALTCISPPARKKISCDARLECPPGPKTCTSRSASICAASRSAAASSGPRSSSRIRCMSAVLELRYPAHSASASILGRRSDMRIGLPVEIKRACLVRAQDACGAAFRDRPLERQPHCLALGGARHHAIEPLRPQQARHRQRHCLQRYVGEPGKALVIDLLLPADLVEVDQLDVERVVEIGDWRVVEGNVAVDPDAEADD